MKKKPIQVRVDENLKKTVEQIFDRIGIDTPTAVRMFFKKVALTGGIPFSLREDLPDTAFFTPEELREAYIESLDAQNLSKSYEDVEDTIKDLKLEV